MLALDVMVKNEELLECDVKKDEKIFTRMLLIYITIQTIKAGKKPKKKPNGIKM